MYKRIISNVTPNSTKELDINKMISNTSQNGNPAQDIKLISDITKETSLHLTSTRDVSVGASTTNYHRRKWITTDRINELRHKAQYAIKHNKIFTIRGCFNSIRNALTARDWVEKLDVHRKHNLSTVCQVTCEDLTQMLPKRKPGETRRQYIAKCEQNIMSRFLEHAPIEFLWTNRKEKCDYIDQTRNPGMTINKFQRAPFTSKEGLCNQLKDFHWFYEEGISEVHFPRCFNVWSPEELIEFIENYKITACIGFIRFIVDHCQKSGFDSVFSPTGKIPFSAVDFAYKRCIEYIDCCHHNDIDLEDQPKVWEHDWEVFFHQQHQISGKGEKVFLERQQIVENIIKTGSRMLENLQKYWPQYSLDGYFNLWIIKPANKCRGRGIQLMDNLKNIINVVKPLIISKSRYVVQKYIERPLIIHHTKFDIRQWFLVTSVQPLVLWMYKESYLRFSSQEYSLDNHHESVHLTNHAVQKKYANGKRDKRLPNENMWDSYSFQAYLRQIGRQDLWLKRIYPGMKKAIIGAMLASQESMDRRLNTFELFGADFMICESFYPWLIEINSSPDLGATTSVTARMCPQCLEDTIKVVIDKRSDPKADSGNFELIYRQAMPTTPAYMGLNLLVKGDRIMSKVNQNYNYAHNRKERSASTNEFLRQKTITKSSIPSKEVMPTYNARFPYSDSPVIDDLSLLYKSNKEQINSTGGTVTTSSCLSPIGICRNTQTASSKMKSYKKKIINSREQPEVRLKRHRSRGFNLITISSKNNEDFNFRTKKWAFQHNTNMIGMHKINMKPEVKDIKIGKMVNRSTSAIIRRKFVISPKKPSNALYQRNNAQSQEYCTHYMIGHNSLYDNKCNNPSSNFVDSADRNLYNSATKGSENLVKRKVPVFSEKENMLAIGKSMTSCNSINDNRSDIRKSKLRSNSSVNKSKCVNKSIAIKTRPASMNSFSATKNTINVS